MAKVRLNIKNKGSKTIRLNGKDYQIPKITLYHRKFFRTDNLDEDMTVHQMILPAIQGILKIDLDIKTEEYEYLAITLLLHNKLLHEEIVYNGEKYSLKDMELCCRNSFVYDGKEYLFMKPIVSDQFKDALDAMNKLQMDTKIDFYEMPAIFFVYGSRLLETIKVVGSNGNVIKGLNDIIDRFFNENEYINLRG